jgi:hypothetical protein
VQAVSIQLTLPEALAREAQSQGLLSASAVEAMLREELRRRRGHDLLGLADRLAKDGTPVMSEAEIDAEIQVARAQLRSRDALGG